jgi:hypothetical protein
VALRKVRQPRPRPEVELTPDTLVQGPDGHNRKLAVERELNTSFVRLFSSPEGEKVINYLNSITLSHVFGPTFDPNALIHKEGQRFIVGLMKQRIQLGKEGK